MKKVFTILSVLSVLPVATPLMANDYLRVVSTGTCWHLDGGKGDDYIQVSDGNGDTGEVVNVGYEIPGGQDQVQWATCEQLCRESDDFLCVYACEWSRRHSNGASGGLLDELTSSNK